MKSKNSNNLFLKYQIKKNKANKQFKNNLRLLESSFHKFRKRKKPLIKLKFYPFIEKMTDLKK